MTFSEFAIVTVVPSSVICESDNDEAAENFGIVFIVPLPPIFALNVAQSVFDNLPVFILLAVGRLKVCVVPADEMAKSKPEVPVANVCVNPVNVFKVRNVHETDVPSVFKILPALPVCEGKIEFKKSENNILRFVAALNTPK